jgi:hypothetical protein
MRILYSEFRIPSSEFWILLLIFSATLSGEIIDRIAIAVANQVITESQIDEDIRVTAFLNRETADLTLAAKREAAGRLIEQALVKREMDLSRYPVPELSAADASLEKLKAMYPSEADFNAALESYGVTLDDLKRRLRWQLTFLRFIDYRFRPGIRIPAADVQAYYRQQISQWQQKGTNPIPTLEASRDQIEEILTQQRIDQALDQWIGDTKKQIAINYLDSTLNPAPNPATAPAASPAPPVQTH